MESAAMTKNRRATRSSLACLPCRSRHMKCDGKRPCCARCLQSGDQCSYIQSRRGGLDRAALAERRKHLASTTYTESVDHPSVRQATEVFHEFTTQPAGVEVRPVSDCLDINVGNSSICSVLQLDDTIAPAKIENDPLIDAYYKNFHICHPFVLPQKHLARLYQDASQRHTLTPLAAALRLVGNIYTTRKWSIPLKDDVEAFLSPLLPSDPIQVQCRMLYSVALFWYDSKAEATSQMDQAVKIAIDLQMFRAEFAISQGADDRIQSESWRRTWWMLYILDAYYAGTLGTSNLRFRDMNVTADLPCSESEYESGDIPTPRTLHEFNHREFNPSNVNFSSFAYLIGAVQCAATAISTVPKNTAMEDSTHPIHAADCSLDGWRLLLPPKHKQVMNGNGDIDELMFQAHLLVHVSTIGLHRPLSALKFNAIETVSSCAREPPKNASKPELVDIHTVRVLRAVEAQIRLLALPARRFHHTPFTTCMVSEGTLALLSACNALLKGKDLAIARDQIRVTLGCLNALGEFWPRTARNVREIQTIAQCVLDLEQHSGDSAVPESSELSSLGAAEISLDCTSRNPSTDENSLCASIGAVENLYDWYNLGDYNELSWGMSNEM